MSLLLKEASFSPHLLIKTSAVSWKQARPERVLDCLSEGSDLQSATVSFYAEWAHAPIDYHICTTCSASDANWRLARRFQYSDQPQERRTLPSELLGPSSRLVQKYCFLIGFVGLVRPLFRLSVSTIRSYSEWPPHVSQCFLVSDRRAKMVNNAHRPDKTLVRRLLCPIQEVEFPLV